MTLSRRLEIILLLLLFTIVVSIIWSLHFQDEMQEYDLYRVALGLLHGRQSGLGVLDPLHYGRWFSFGYVPLSYALGGEHGFDSRASVFHLINAIGFVSVCLIIPFAWAAIRLVYGGAAALISTALFVTSPTFLEVATSGHQMLLAIALFMIAATLLFAPTRGWVRAIMLVLGLAVLAAGLMIRFEIAFAFPFVVLAASPGSDFRADVRRSLENLVVGVVALALFFGVRALVLPGQADGAGELVSNWYTLANLPKGVVVAVLAAGVITTLLGVWALVVEAMTIKPSEGLIRIVLERIWLAAPVALIVSELLFWILNPLPARHFLLFSFGLSVLIGAIAANRVRWGAGVVVVGLVVAAIANQAAAVAISPAFRRVDPAIVVKPLSVAENVPAGSLWRRHAVMLERDRQMTAMGSRIRKADCIPDLVVYSQNYVRLLLGLYEAGPPPQLTPSRFYFAMVSPKVEAHYKGRKITYIMHYIHGDELNAALRDPAYAHSKFFVDPYSVEIGQPAAAPPDRATDLNCGPKS